MNKFQKSIDKINRDVDVSYNKDYIVANVDVLDDEVIYTSIPYDKGFSVFVDGSKVEYTKVFDTFIGLEVSKGKHVIEFKYMPRGLKLGSCMSFIGIFAFIISKKVKK